MRIPRRLIPAIVGVAMLTLLAGGAWAGNLALPAMPASLDTIYLAITPTDTMVSPGATFDLHLRVTQPGKLFNAYDAIIAYDPAALTFIQRSPVSLQEGSYMKLPPPAGGGCGNTFHRFAAAGDSLTINHSLLCQGIELSGPGILYNLRFQASMTPQVCVVSIRWTEFYNAGLYARPVAITNSRVQDGEPIDVVPSSPTRDIRLRITPNPFNPATVIDVEFLTAGTGAVSVSDVSGRRVRTLARGLLPSPVGRWVWDGRDDRGLPVAAGVYLVSIQDGRARAAARAVLVK